MGFYRNLKKGNVIILVIGSRGLVNNIILGKNDNRS